MHCRQDRGTGLTAGRACAALYVPRPLRVSLLMCGSNLMTTAQATLFTQMKMKTYRGTLLTRRLKLLLATSILWMKISHTRFDSEMSAVV